MCLDVRLRAILIWVRVVCFVCMCVGVSSTQTAYLLPARSVRLVQTRGSAVAHINTTNRKLVLLGRTCVCRVLYDECFCGKRCACVRACVRALHVASVWE